MNYNGINDYELIYLIRDGNEYAFEFFTKKYLDYIDYLISKYYSYVELKDELREIGLNVLYKCLETYNESLNVKFNLLNNDIEINFIDSRCQYIYCPLSELKKMVCDTRLCIGDYSVLRALRVNTARPITNEELFD